MGRQRERLVAVIVVGALAVANPPLSVAEQPSRMQVVDIQSPASNWSAPPQDYSFEPPVPCRDAPDRAARPARPRDARYAVCADQMALFLRAVAEARAGGKLLLVTFGATWCEWCANLQRQLASPGLFGSPTGSGALGTDFHHVEIGISMTFKGEKSAIPSGERVLAHVLSRAKSVAARSVPFVAVIDPTSADRVAARNLDDIAIGSRGEFDVERLRDVLNQAAAHVRSGASAPAEPGWLRRKLLRWWYS